ncbi:MAG: hypothetical protein H2069_03755 [Legionella sp.]|nr:hypothetical protein [Legionella sp.]
MKNTLFSAAFFAIGEDEESLQKENAFANLKWYGEEPVYYPSNVFLKNELSLMSPYDEIAHRIEEELPEDLAEWPTEKLMEAIQVFAKSPDYQKIKCQFLNLTDALTAWCEANECLVVLADVTDTLSLEIPAFQLLYKHLFDGDNLSETFYGSHPQSQILLWTQGKWLLENIYHLLVNDDNFLITKKIILRDLQKQVQVCAPGIITQLVLAQSAFSATKNIQRLLLEVKEALALDIISAHLHDAFYLNLKGNQIHYANAYRNHIADRIGISEIIGDHYADATKLTEGDIDYFEDFFWEKMTPTAVIFRIYNILQPAFDQQFTRIEIEWKQRFGEENAISLERFCQQSLISQEGKTYESMETCVNESVENWNTRYGILCPINATFFVTLEGEGVIPVPAASVRVLAEIVKNFSAQFLKDKTIQTLSVVPAGQSSLQHGNSALHEAFEQATFCFKEGFYWAELPGNTVTLDFPFFLAHRPCNVEDIPRYYKMLGILLDAESSVEQQAFHDPIETAFQKHDGLFKTFTGCINEHLMCALAQIPITLFLLKLNYITEEYIADNLEFFPKKEKIMWHLVKEGYIGQLEIFLQQQRLTKAYLDYSPTKGALRGRTLLWLDDESRHKLLTITMNQGLLTSQYLSRIDPKNINLLWHLATCDRIDLMCRFLDKRLIQADMLQNSPNCGSLAGVNVLHCMMRKTAGNPILRNEAEHFFKALVEANLISIEHLQALPTHPANPTHGQNLIFILAQNKQHALLKLLLNHKLLSRDLLAQKVNAGFHQGESALWLMARAGDTEFISLLNAQQLITMDMLAASPTNQVNRDAGKNVLWLIAHWNDYALLKTLFARSDLEKTLISAKAEQAEARGVNVLWQLVRIGYFDLIDSLAERGFINAEMLASMDEQDQKMSALCRLVILGQDNLLKKCLDKGYFNSALLAQTINNTNCSGINAVWLMAYKGFFDLLISLTQCGLVQRDMLTATLSNSEQAGWNVIWFLTDPSQKGIVLLRLLLSKNYITPAVLSQKALHGNWKGIHAFWHLAKNNQFEMIEDFIHQNGITDEMLNARPLNKKNAMFGVNVLWLMTYFKQEKLIKACILYNNITSSMLAEGPVDGKVRGANLVWLLARKGYFGLIEILLAKNLITAPMLVIAVKEASVFKDVLGLLADAKQYSLLKALIKQQSVNILASRAERQIRQSFERLLSTLLHTKEYVLIQWLLNEGLLEEKILDIFQACQWHEENKTMEPFIEVLLEQKQLSLVKLIEDKQLFSHSKIRATLPKETKGLLLMLTLYLPNTDFLPLLARGRTINADPRFVKNVCEAFSEILRKEPFDLVRAAWGNPLVKKTLKEATVDMQRMLLQQLLGLMSTRQLSKAHFFSLSNLIKNYLMIIENPTLLAEVSDQLEKQNLKENKILKNKLENKASLIEMITVRKDTLDEAATYSENPYKKLHTESTAEQSQDFSVVNDANIRRLPSFHPLPFFYNSNENEQSQNADVAKLLTHTPFFKR